MQFAKIKKIASLTSGGERLRLPPGVERYSELFKGGKKCQQLTSSLRMAELRRLRKVNHPL
jgi:hypothetical protein